MEEGQKKPHALSKPTVELLGLQLTKIKRAQEQLPTAIRNLGNRSETTKFRFSHLQLYGKGSLAYSSLQQGIKYFMHSELGYIAYVPLDNKNESVVVLADPICKQAEKKTLLEEFIAEVSEPIFIHISHDTAEVLHDMGFFVNQLGVETILDIQTFDLVGNKKQQLRSARNGAQKDNLSVIEVLSVDNEKLKELKNISDEWMKDCVVSSRELQFLVRPIVYVDEQDVRKFVALKDDKIVGFVFFDPMYEEGKVIGYIANHLRSNLDRSYSVTDFIILQALEQFKQEGKRDMSLGLSPLAKVSDTDDFRHSKIIKEHFRYCFEKGNFLYNFQNLARHKGKYRPDMPGAREERVYCAMKTAFPLLKLYGIYRVLGFSPVSQTIEHIVDVSVRKLKSLFREAGAPSDKLETK